MKEIKIENLSYLLKQAKDTKQPQPIFFLGAGASRSGHIPLGEEIIKQILNNYSDSPFIKDLPNKERTYAKLMDCLLPNQRNELLKKYIDEAKINVTHIYLAQLIKEGFVDYVLTVNFDNLMLRALALFNIFPSTYDLAILKDLTTSTINEKSVVYLHGQSHGLWLLNTHEEMEKVKNIVPRIFDTIKNKRPWVFIGYSGEDPIFDHVKNLGRFDNGLYWITYNDNSPCETVLNFLSEPNTNASIIKGYDSDSFMLRLNSELGLAQPIIVDKPFTALKNMLEEMVDIDDKESFKGVKERLNISKKQVEEAIQQFEQGKAESIKNVEENKIDLLKKEIINLIISQKYNDEAISNFEVRVNVLPDVTLKSLLAGLYSNWGIYFGNLAKTKQGKEAEALYLQSFEKLQKSIDIKPENHYAYYNWGTELGNLAKTKQGKEAEALHLQSFEKLQKAIEIKPDSNDAYNNWGVYLGNLAKTNEGKKADALYYQSFEKFQKAIEIKPENHQAYANWGIYLGNLAKTKDVKEAETLYNQSFEKYQKAIEINPNYHEAYYNWGNDLVNLAKTKDGKEAEALYNQSFEKFQKAIEINPDYHEAYNNWGNNLGYLAKTKEGIEAEVLFNQSFEKFKKALELKPENHELYNYLGANIGNLAKTKKEKEAEALYHQSFEKYQKAIKIKPDYHEAYNNWGIDLLHMAKTKEGREAETLYNQSFEKFQKAIEIKPEKHETYLNWGVALGYLAKTKEGREAEVLYNQSLEKLQKAFELGGSCYDLACLHAIKKNSKKALCFLDLSLTKNEIPVHFVENDEDWKCFLKDSNFTNILNKHRKLNTKE